MEQLTEVAQMAMEWCLMLTLMGPVSMSFMILQAARMARTLMEEFVSLEIG